MRSLILCLLLAIAAPAWSAEQTRAASIPQLKRQLAVLMLRDQSDADVAAAVAEIRALLADVSNGIDVTDYGAIANDDLDDAAAIQAAVNAATGGRVLFPAGKFNLSSTITIASACVLEGVAANGPGAPTTPTQTFLVHDFSGTCLNFTGSATSDTVGSGCGIRNLTILQNHGNATTNSGIAVRNHSTSNTQRSNWFRMDNVHIEEVSGKNGWQYCVSLDGTANADLLRDVFIRGCRFVAGTNATAAVRVAGVANLLMSDCEANLSNADLLLTGDGTHLTASALIANCTFDIIAHDFAQFCSIVGGSCSTITYTANSVDNQATGIAVGGSAPTILGTRNTVVGRAAATGKYSVYTNNNVRFDMGANTAEFTGPVNSTTALSTGATPATAGAIRLSSGEKITGRNAANTGNIELIQLDGVDRLQLAPAGADILWGRPMVALGGGAAPTVGTIGGSGPAAAAQRGWIRIIESDGTASFIPCWR